MLVWFTGTAPLWIAGALSDREIRLVWWALAAGIEFLGTLLAHPVPGQRLESENVPFDAEHMLERCRLFLLIALGETVLTTGNAISAAPLTVTTVFAGTSAFVGTVALWSMVFGRIHRLVASHAEETKDPIRASRYGVYVMMATVAGLIGVAVANRLAVAEPYRMTSLAVALMLGGGPVLLLLAQAGYLKKVVKADIRTHLFGVAALLFVSAATLLMPAYLGVALVGLSLTALTAVDQRMCER